MLNDIEMKLLRLALDKGAYDGEADNAGVMLVRKLRERNANVDDLFVIHPPPHKDNDVSVYGQQRMTFGKYENEILADIPMSYLIWVLTRCRNISPNLRKAIEKVVYGG